MSGFRKLSQTFCIANIIWYSCRPIFLVKIRLAVIRQGVFACFILSKASIAKVHAAEVAVMVTNKAMELMGLYGYVRDYNVEKY
jgi:alkylation response protein AidB-like acyl-CoA dehydrogenase